MNRRFIALFVSLGLLGAHCASTCSDATKAKRDVRLLVLIIASDQFPVYVELQKILKSYMHNDPQHVETYFIRANPNLSTQYAIEGDVIWSKSEDGWPPHSSGIIDKTILSLEAMVPRLDEFDYVLRTNLSSFYVYPRLLKVLQTLPRKNCYFGSQLGENMASGCGFIMSTDVAKLLVDNKAYFIGNKNHDDVLVGLFMRSRGIKLISHARPDLITRADWEKLKNNIPADVFQFRIKCDDKMRLVDDIYMHSQLYKMFYAR